MIVNESDLRVSEIMIVGLSMSVNVSVSVRLTASVSVSENTTMIECE